MPEEARGVVVAWGLPLGTLGRGVVVLGPEIRWVLAIEAAPEPCLQCMIGNTPAL